MGWNQQQRLQMEINQPFLTHMTFRQIHRSYIVNMKHAASVERTSITLDNGVKIPVSGSRRSEQLMKEITTS